MNPNSPCLCASVVRNYFRIGVSSVALAVVMSFSGCVPWLRVQVRPADPPAFRVCGSLTSMFQRKVAYLSVYGAPADEPAATRVLWQIQAQREPRPLNEVLYGVVPEGFSQTVPVDGDAPSLRADWTYTVTVGGGSGSGHERFLHTGTPVTAESLRAVRDAGDGLLPGGDDP